MHRDANAARRTQEGVQRMGPGGMFAKQFAQRDDAVVVAMKLPFWLLKENIALKKWNSVKLLLKSLGADEISRLSLARNATYSGRPARDNMLSALFSVVRKTLSLLLDATFSSVLSDETTDIANKGQLVVHFCCVKSGIIRTRFGGVVEVSEPNAASIQHAIKKAADWSLDRKKCHFASDGASVFTGRKSGVVVPLMRDHDMYFSTAVHCIGHREALAAADAVKAVSNLEQAVAPSLGSIYHLFNNSSSKEAGLHELQRALYDI